MLHPNSQYVLPLALGYNLISGKVEVMDAIDSANKSPAGDIIRYTTCSEHCFNACVSQKCISKTEKSGQLNPMTQSTAASRGRTDIYLMI